jgi:hypothetical protein
MLRELPFAQIVKHGLAVPMEGARSAMKTGSAGFVRSRAEVGD